MKILVTYFSQTGNTEKIAKAMIEGLSPYDVIMQKVQDCDSNSISDYDVIFLGSGIYAGKVHKSVDNLIKKAESFPPKFVFFSTHASPEAYQYAFKKIEQKITSDGSQILGEWDCRGANLGIPKQMLESRLENLPPKEREKAEKDMQELSKHPDANDLKNAKEFASKIIQ